MKTKTIVYYDPLGFDGQVYLDAALSWLRHESIAKKRLSLTDLSSGVEWTLEQAGKNQPQQGSNVTECGVFVCMTAGCIADDIPINAGLYTLQDVYRFRERIGCDLLRGGFTYPLLTI